MHKRIFMLLFLLLAGLMSVFFVFNSSIYRQKQGNPEVIRPYPATLTGTQVCLPSAPGTVEITLECAIGMKTDTGEYYALDFRSLPGGNPDFTANVRFTAQGTVTPLEMLSADRWQKYTMQGIFTVRSIVSAEELPDAL